MFASQLKFKNWVRTWRYIVTFCSRYFSVFLCLFHHIINVTQVFNQKTSWLIFIFIVISFEILFLNQISDSFKIDFLKCARNLKLPAVVLKILHRFENLINSSWNESFFIFIPDIALHCMSLSRSSLSVWKDADFESIDCWTHEFLNFLENLNLSRFMCKAIVKLKKIRCWSISHSCLLSTRTWKNLNSLMILKP